MAVPDGARIFNPGDLIYSEKAFATVLARDKKNHFCEFCMKEVKDLIACKICGEVSYCSVSCMEADSSDHQLECQYLKKLPEEDIIRDEVHLVGKIILKIKGKDWKEVKTEILGREYSFDDIDPYHDKMTKEPTMILRYKHLKISLRKFIGEENLPEENELLKIVGKVINNNNYGLCYSSPLMYCFFIGSASFRRECIPNANLEVLGHKNLKVWACKRIDTETEQVSITLHSVLLLPPKEPNECSCTECSKPYGESIFTKIIDEDKAFRVVSSTNTVLRLIECEKFMGDESQGMAVLAGLINYTLREQNGVLAETNARHLRLLGHLCYSLTQLVPKTELVKYLEELEKIMSSIFGEYFLDMELIYCALASNYATLGNIEAAKRYLEKYKRLTIHREEDFKVKYITQQINDLASGKTRPSPSMGENVSPGQRKKSCILS